MPLWQRLVIVGVVVLATTVVARLIDRRIARCDLPPEAITRYRVLLRSVTTTIMFVGLLSALLVIPQVRAVAGGLLASSAVLGIVVGFASQRTLGNFVAGLLIAFNQPVRLGDDVVIEDTEGIVEEIGLIYTFVRTRNGDRLVIPNEKLASDTIRNSTIRSREKVAEITLQVTLGRGHGARSRAHPRRQRVHRRCGLDVELRPELAASGRRRPELVRVRSRRLFARLDPGGEEPPAGRPQRHEQVGCARHSRDRG